MKTTYSALTQAFKQWTTIISLCLGLSVTPLALADEASKKSATKMLDAMNMELTLSQSIEQMLNLQLQQNPALAPYKDIMLGFLQKHMSYESLKDEMVQLYANEFTAKELDEITAFYKTKVGKKTVEKMPALMAAGGQIGAQRVQANMPELQSLIQAESERLQKAGQQ